MNEYNVIAGVYDKINSGVDYDKRAATIDGLLAKYTKEKPELVLDLACGTGKMSLALAARGYDVIGVDASPEMLAKAADAVYDAIDEGKPQEDAKRPLFLCQTMTSLELYGTVGATVCCLDSLNYLINDGELQKCFSLVHNYLDPDGLFIFDVNTPYKFEKIYGDNAYVYDVEKDETGEGGSFCIWQNFYDRESRTCDFYLTVFEDDGNGKYVRADEDQRERCYSMDEILSAMNDAGFELLEVSADFFAGEPNDESCRWHFCARAKK